MHTRAQLLCRGRCRLGARHSSPIKAIRVQVNGRQVDEQTPDIGSGEFAAGRAHPRRAPEQGQERGAHHTHLHRREGRDPDPPAQGEGALDKRGTLYILAIGVDKYPVLGKTCGREGKASCDLTFSGADAPCCCSSPATASMTGRTTASWRSDVPRTVVPAITLKCLPLPEAEEVRPCLRHIGSALSGSLILMDCGDEMPWGAVRCGGGRCCREVAPMSAISGRTEGSVQSRFLLRVISDRHDEPRSTVGLRA